MTNYGDYFTPDYFAKGERVELHPATDAWMMGDRFGNVTHIGRKLVHVKMDRSGLVRRCTRSRGRSSPRSCGPRVPPIRAKQQAWRLP